jgi:hypothetical protein
LEEEIITKIKGNFEELENMCYNTSAIEYIAEFKKRTIADLEKIKKSMEVLENERMSLLISYEKMKEKVLCGTDKTVLEYIPKMSWEHIKDLIELCSSSYYKKYEHAPFINFEDYFEPVDFTMEGEKEKKTNNYVDLFYLKNRYKGTANE